MNQQLTQNLFNPRLRVQAAIQSKTVSFAFGVIAVLLIALLAYTGLSVNVPPAGGAATSAASLAANPELMVARRSIAPAAASDAFLAANPELMLARRLGTAAREGNVCTLRC
jgi:hypothetical protein